MSTLTKAILNQPIRILRRARSWVRNRLFPRYRARCVVLRCPRGLGDNLMLTTVAREVRKRSPGAMIHVITRHPEVFERNPDVDFVSREVVGQFRWPAFQLHYAYDFPWKKHFIDSLCDKVGIRNGIDLRTYIYPGQTDWDFADQLVAEVGSSPVLIARTSGAHDAQRKIWPTPYWTELVEELAQSGAILDIGNSGEPLQLRSPNYRNLIGQTTLHQLAALMSRARALVTMDSAPNHLAAAFGLPTVCILGGIFPPSAIHYPNSKVLVSRPACCNCWPANHCHRNLECLGNITVDDVKQALNEISPAIRVHASNAKQIVHPIAAT